MPAHNNASVVLASLLSASFCEAEGAAATPRASSSAPSVTSKTGNATLAVHSTAACGVRRCGSDGDASTNIKEQPLVESKSNQGVQRQTRGCPHLLDPASAVALRSICPKSSGMARSSRMARTPATLVAALTACIPKTRRRLNRESERRPRFLAPLLSSAGFRRARVAPPTRLGAARRGFAEPSFRVSGAGAPFWRACSLPSPSRLRPGPLLVPGLTATPSLPVGDRLFRRFHGPPRLGCEKRQTTSDCGQDEAVGFLVGYRGIGWDVRLR